MRFRFTILSLLLVTTVLAILIAAVVVFPPVFGACILTTMPLVCGSVLLAWSTVVTGFRRTFAIAAAIPQVVAALYSYGGMIDELDSSWRTYGYIWQESYMFYEESDRTLWAVLLGVNFGLSVLTGVIAMAMHRLTLFITPRER